MTEVESMVEQNGALHDSRLESVALDHFCLSHAPDSCRLRVNLSVPSRQLYEQTADINRLREYVERWVNWHRSGLRGLIEQRNRFQRLWLYVIKTLNIIENKAHPF